MAVVLLGVGNARERYLPQIARAFGSLRLLADYGNRREENADQQRDNSNGHEQFNQRKTAMN
jgi:hypothetical protein